MWPSSLRCENLQVPIALGPKNLFSFWFCFHWLPIPHSSAIYIQMKSSMQFIRRNRCINMIKVDIILKDGGELYERTLALSLISPLIHEHTGVVMWRGCNYGGWFVPLSRCRDVALSRCRDVALSRCRVVALSRCRVVALSRCRDVALSRCRVVAMSRCRVVAMSRCRVVAMSRCRLPVGLRR